MIFLILWGNRTNLILLPLRTRSLKTLFSSYFAIYFLFISRLTGGKGHNLLDKFRTIKCTSFQKEDKKHRDSLWLTSKPGNIEQTSLKHHWSIRLAAQKHSSQQHICSQPTSARGRFWDIQSLLCLIFISVCVCLYECIYNTCIWVP